MTKAAVGPAVFSVRRVASDDVHALVAMCAEHARYERAAYDPRGKAAALQRALFATPARLHAWLAESRNEAIGYVATTSEYSTWAAAEFLHMDALFVRDGHRGAGIGAALLAAAMRFARERGHAEVQWQTPHWNTRAQRFYRREGAVAAPKIRFTLATGAAPTPKE